MIKNILIFFIAFTLASCASSSSYFTVRSSDLAQGEHPKHYKLSSAAFWQGSPYTIWGKLSHIPLPELERAQSSVATPTAVGWLKLAVISKRYNNDTTQLVKQLTDWRSAYPNHPGNKLFPENSVLTSLNNVSQPKHLAVLLPLQGKFGAMGQSVRDGFLNGYYENHSDQAISFYDTTSNSNVDVLYKKALSDGADVVIGPLTKDDVQALAHSGSLTVPTIALNYTTNSAPNNLYEFGLSPLDETNQAAEKAWDAGHSRALVIAENNEWGQNLSSHLISSWQAKGGVVSGTFYFTSQTDMNSAIANLMHINPKADHDLARKKGTTKEALQKQRRHDFDVVFLFAHPDSARSIVPLLHFYYLDKTPIYSTSAIYSGKPTPEKDVDLNGVLFSDVPYVLKANTPTANSDPRLFAVGHDAYLISRDLQRLKVLPNFPVYASTGALTITAQNQVYRKLPWALMHDGHP